MLAPCRRYLSHVPAASPGGGWQKTEGWTSCREGRVKNDDDSHLQSIMMDCFYGTLETATLNGETTPTIRGSAMHWRIPLPNNGLCYVRVVDTDFMHTLTLDGRPPPPLKAYVRFNDGIKHRVQAAICMLDCTVQVSGRNLTLTIRMPHQQSQVLLTRAWNNTLSIARSSYAF